MSVVSAQRASSQGPDLGAGREPSEASDLLIKTAAEASIPPTPPHNKSYMTDVMISAGLAPLGEGRWDKQTSRLPQP